MWYHSWRIFCPRVNEIYLFETKCTIMQMHFKNIAKAEYNIAKYVDIPFKLQQF